MGKKATMFRFEKPEYSFEFFETSTLSMEQLEASYKEYKKLVAGLTRLGLLNLTEPDGSALVSFDQLADNGKLVVLAAQSYYDFIRDLTGDYQTNLANLASAVTPVRFSIITGKVSSLPLVFLSSLRTGRLVRHGKGKITFTNMRGEVTEYDNMETVSVDEALDVLEVFIHDVSEVLLTPNGVSPSPSKAIRLFTIFQFFRSGFASFTHANRLSSDFRELPPAVREQVFVMIEEELNMFSSLYTLSKRYEHSRKLAGRKNNGSEPLLTTEGVRELSTFPRIFIRSLLLEQF